ncbi:MAG: restriction endonuclease subunit S [Thermodesulfovibrionales bacterium]
MGEWKETYLGEIAEVIDSLHRTPIYSEKGYPMVRVTDIKPGYLNLENTLTVDESTFIDFSQKRLPRRGDIVFSRVGSYGVSSLVNSDEPFCLGQNTTFIVAKENPFFLYYFLNTPNAKSQIDGLVAGSTQPTISLQSIKEIVVPFPPRSEQDAIVAILSSLDDKIDLLHRQNKTLEALAETLFRQWFVEDEAEDGWEIGTVKDFFTLQRGFDLPAQHRTDGKYPIISASGVNGYHHECKVQAPGVTTGRSGLLGQVYYIMDDFWPLNTSLFIVEYKLAKPLFAYFFLKTLDLEGLNGGSAVPTLNRNDVHSLETTLPPLELIDRFESLTLPMFRKIKENRNQIQTLTGLRDSLLPKLMSGEVRVKDTGEQHNGIGGKGS